MRTPDEIALEIRARAPLCFDDELAKRIVHEVRAYEREQIAGRLEVTAGWLREEGLGPAARTLMAMVVSLRQDVGASTDQAPDPQPKRPTICVECLCLAKVWETGTPPWSTSGWRYLCPKGPPDPVTGHRKIVEAYEKNDGACPDFEPTSVPRTAGPPARPEPESPRPTPADDFALGDEPQFEDAGPRTLWRRFRDWLNRPSPATEHGDC